MCGCTSNFTGNAGKGQGVKKSQLNLMGSQVFGLAVNRKSKNTGGCGCEKCSGKMDNFSEPATPATPVTQHEDMHAEDKKLQVDFFHKNRTVILIVGVLIIGIAIWKKGQ